MATSDGASVILTWTDNSNEETAFRIDVAPGPINTDADVTEYATVAANVTTYTYSTLPNTTRYFRILAITATYQSDPSNVISITTPDAPLPPANFVANVGPTSDKDVLLTWSDLPSETGYEIERSANGGAWLGLVSFGSDVTTYTDATTAYNSEYGYRIKATTPSGTSAPSPAAYAQTRTTTVTMVSVSSTWNADVSWFTSIAVAPDGTAHVSHLDHTWGDTWYTQIIPIGGSSSQVINPGFPETLGWTGTSLARETNGTIHVVANDVYTDHIYYLTPGSPPAWSATAIAYSGATDRASLRLAPGDKPHIIYQQGSQLYHAFISSGGWTSEFAASNVPDHFDFCIDATGGLHVAFRRPIPGGFELVYARKSGAGSWSTTVVPSAGTPEYVSVAVDAGADPHIAYNELTTYGLHHATNAGGSWTTEMIHQTPGGSWGRFSSIAIDSGTGRIHVAYSDMLYENLRYARKDPAGTWQLKLLDAVGTVGRWTSLALGPAGVYISYGDLTNGDLKVASGAP
jgi:hypothetical protein